MKVSIEKAGKSKVRLIFAGEDGAETSIELHENQVETLHSLCVAAIRAKVFRMSIETSVKVSRG